MNFQNENEIVTPEQHSFAAQQSASSSTHNPSTAQDAAMDVDSVAGHVAAVSLAGGNEAAPQGPGFTPISNSDFTVEKLSNPKGLLRVRTYATLIGKTTGLPMTPRAICNRRTERSRLPRQIASGEERLEEMQSIQKEDDSASEAEEVYQLNASRIRRAALRHKQDARVHEPSRLERAVDWSAPTSVERDVIQRPRFQFGANHQVYHAPRENVAQLLEEQKYIEDTLGLNMSPTSIRARQQRRAHQAVQIRRLEDQLVDWRVRLREVNSVHCVDLNYSQAMQLIDRVQRRMKMLGISEEVESEVPPGVDPFFEDETEDDDDDDDE